MIFFVIALCAILFFIGLFFEKRKLNPITIFFGEWGIIAFLSSKNYFLLQPAEDSTYSLIFVGCLFFAMGFYLYKICFAQINIYNVFNDEKFYLEFKSNNKYVANKMAIIILSIICISFFFFDFSKSIFYLMEGGLNVLRQRAQEGVLYSNSFLNAIRILIAAPFSLALTTIASVSFFKVRKINYILVFAILILAERLLSDGGRSPMIYLGFSFIIVYNLLYGKRSRTNLFKIKIKFSRKNIYIIALCILFSYLLYIITLSRSGSNSLRFSYFYFAMEPIMLEKWNSIVYSTGLLGYGMASFNGILFPFFYIIVNLFKLSGYPVYWREIYDLIQSVGTNWQVITSSGLTANSYSSIFWTFYLDGHLTGIIIGSSIYGAFVSHFYNKALHFPNEKNIALYVFILIGVFYSFQEFIFENIYYTIAFLELLFFAYRRKK